MTGGAANDRPPEPPGSAGLPFVGRRFLTERILQTIHNNSLLIQGAPGIGKTALLHHLRQRIERLDDPHIELLPVYVDLRHLPRDTFFTVLGHEILHSLPATGCLPQVQQLGTGSADRGYRYLAGSLRRLITRLEQTRSRPPKIVLLLDEIDLLASHDPRINQRLRSLFMKSFAERLVAVVAGVEISKEWGRECSPWYNFFEELEIGPLDREEVGELLGSLTGGSGAIPDGVVQRAWELTTGRPDLVARLGTATRDRLRTQPQWGVTVADIESAARRCNLDGRPE